MSRISRRPSPVRFTPAPRISPAPKPTSGVSGHVVLTVYTESRPLTVEMDCPLPGIGGAGDEPENLHVRFATTERGGDSFEIAARDLPAFLEALDGAVQLARASGVDV